MYERGNGTIDAKIISKDQFSELYSLYATDILRVCFFYTKDMGKAEDICQETFVKLITFAPDLEEGKEKAWLLKVALNKCKDYWRSAWLKNVTLGDDGLKYVPSQNYTSGESINEELISAIQELPPKFKEIIILHYYQGYGVAEIAKILGISQGTVSSRLARGRDKLSIMLRGKS